MTRRSVAQLSELENAILALSRKVGKGKGDEKLYAAEVLIRRLRKANERDRAGSAIPDGYPRGSGFEGGGGLRVTVIEDEHGPQESMEVTGVEWAIFQSDERIAREENRKTIKDHHHDLTGQANDELANMVGAHDRLLSLLARIDNLIDLAPGGNADSLQRCRSHARVTDRLGREYFEGLPRDKGARDGLCRWCYGWTLDHDGELPAVGLLERLILHGKVTSKDIDEVARSKRRAS